jgi:hypothetical protein
MQRIEELQSLKVEVKLLLGNVQKVKTLQEG